MRARLGLLAAALGLGTLLALALPGHPAAAHPLGNFSVNQLDALDLYPGRIDVTAIVDTAELPTLQDKSTVDANGTAGYAATTCTAISGDFTVSVDGHRLIWTVSDSGYGYGPGSAGLPTGRLQCKLSAPATLGSPSSVDVANRYRSDRIGWRELTAVGHGIGLIDSPLPTRNVSDDLRAYPQDLLSSPLDVRTAHLRTTPGTGSGTSASAPTLHRAGWTTRLTADAEQILQRRLAGHLTPLVGVLAVLLALALGAGHAALPGHGKTVMAVYLAGRAGRIRDAAAVGATVTLTHTGGVLLLGLLLSAAASVAGETVLGWCGVASGALVAVLGLTMLTRLRRRHPRSHSHSHHDGHVHSHDHHGHDHSHRHGEERPGRLAIAGIGIAGGLVPSPSALVILLGAIGLGRTGFGVLLVAAYGLGMAGTLTAAGLVLIALRRRWAGRQRPSWTRPIARLSAAAPAATAGLVLLVGLGLTGRALATLA
jgi:ABC-type nickel/cobalt efflux system permease component RcnA